MRSAKLLIAIAFAASTASSQTARPLTYRGWAIGISFDSAQKLAYRDIRAPLACDGVGDGPLQCTAVSLKTATGSVSVQLSRPPRRVIDIGLMHPLDAHASVDSAKREFVKLWGKPLDMTRMMQKMPPLSRSPMPLGVWRENETFATLSDATFLGKREFFINIIGAEHTRMEMIAAFKRMGLSDDSIRVLTKRFFRNP